MPTSGAGLGHIRRQLIGRRLARSPTSGRPQQSALDAGDRRSTRAVGHRRGHATSHRPRFLPSRHRPSVPSTPHRPSGVPGATPVAVVPAAGTAAVSAPSGPRPSAGAPRPAPACPPLTAGATVPVGVGPTAPAAVPPATPEAATVRTTTRRRPRAVSRNRPTVGRPAAAAVPRGAVHASWAAGCRAARDPTAGPRLAGATTGAGLAGTPIVHLRVATRRGVGPRRPARPHAPGPSVHTAVMIAPAVCSNARSNVATSLTQPTDTTVDFRTAV